MKRQVLTYVKPAKELSAGDRILTGRMTVAEVKSVELFDDASKRPCVEARIAERGRRSSAVYVADDLVMVLE